ncbi:DUF721 domain-containing protein [Pelagibacterium montanilacus]|uniref:DUF721 domain-containing protein n=1 Tax=Pelagibacterium montanilacus TaxID=2185280 RepID=UPI0013DF2EDA|nr:DciA family protein [Pelagibacterium montanilacus]
MAAKSPPPKRRNRTVQLGDMIGSALDPALKRRGFASRDLIARWPAIAPTPWDQIAMPDRLTWPRRDRPDPEGAVLYLRCVEGHALALAHEGPAIAAAINRYFGYLLVSTVRSATTPFDGAVPAPAAPPPALPRETEEMIRTTLAPVEDPDLKAALERLGTGMAHHRRRGLTSS